MKLMIKSLFVISTCFFVFSAKAQKKDMPIIWYYNYFVGNDTMQFGKTYLDQNQRPYKLERFQFYTSGIELVDTDGDTVKLPQNYVLTTGKDGGHSLGTHNIGKLVEIKFNLGVDSMTNHTDPSTYPEFHTLSPQNPTMHWGWESGYRFWVIEGWLDDNDDGKFDVRFEYHMIGDVMLRTKTLNTSGIEKDGKLFIVIDVQLNELFDSLDFAINSVIHGGPWDTGSEPLIKIANNAVQREVFTTGVGFNLNTPKTDYKTSRMVYPNPSNGEITIKNNPTSLIKDIQVFSPNGKRVDAELNRSSSNLILLDLEPGIYWIKITDYNNQSITVKTIVVE